MDMHVDTLHESARKVRRAMTHWRSSGNWSVMADCLADFCDLVATKEPPEDPVVPEPLEDPETSGVSVPASELLPKCIRGCTPYRARSNEGYWIHCDPLARKGMCGASTPMCETQTEAVEVWTRMMAPAPVTETVTLKPTEGGQWEASCRYAVATSFGGLSAVMNAATHHFQSTDIAIQRDSKGNWKAWVER
jgi:hypothetical protein